MKRSLALFLVLSSCAQPGKEVRPVEGAFAFLEMKLGS
jgi:hypothetical protein